MRIRSVKIAQRSGWFLESDVEGPGIELDHALRSLLDKIEPKTEALYQLENDGYFIVWRGVVATNGLEHDIELERETLRRLVDVPGVLRLDVYDDGSLWGDPTQ